MKFLSTMKKLIVLFLTSVLQESMSFCDVGNETDPCAIANSTNPFEPGMRSENCKQSTLSDIRLKSGWYNFYAEMLDYPPKIQSCGAVNPYWLNGNISIDVNQTVERTVCKVAFPGTCVRQVKIKIKNCGTFTAYCLPALEGDSERYCFGKYDPNCESNATTTSSTVASTKVMTTESSFVERTLQRNPIGVKMKMVGIIIGTVLAVMLFIVIYMYFVMRQTKKLKGNYGKKVKVSEYNTLNRCNEEESQYGKLFATKEVLIKDNLFIQPTKKFFNNTVHVSDEEHYATIKDCHI